jgi:hypothetical protein
MFPQVKGCCVIAATISINQPSQKLLNNDDIKRNGYVCDFTLAVIPDHNQVVHLCSPLCIYVQSRAFTCNRVHFRAITCICVQSRAFTCNCVHVHSIVCISNQHIYLAVINSYKNAIGTLERT